MTFRPSEPALRSPQCGELVNACAAAAADVREAPRALRLAKAAFDPNETGRNGLTALMMAAFAGNAELMHALLDAGANPLAHTTDGQSIFYFAMRESVVRRASGALTSAQTLRLLLDRRGDVFRAKTVCFMGPFAGGAVPIDKPDGDGYTPLGRAADLGDAESCRILLAAGADPKALSPVSCKPATAMAKGAAIAVFRAPAPQTDAQLALQRSHEQADREARALAQRIGMPWPQAVGGFD